MSPQKRKHDVLESSDSHGSTVATSRALTDRNGSLDPARYGYITKALHDLRRSADARSYKIPVDYVGLNIPSYPKVVKQPMDISTMRKKLRDRVYRSVTEIEGDFELMVQNSLTFNGPDHVVTQEGQRLNQSFKRHLLNLPTVDLPNVSLIKPLEFEAGQPSQIVNALADGSPALGDDAILDRPEKQGRITSSRENREALCSDAREPCNETITAALRPLEEIIASQNVKLDAKQNVIDEMTKAANVMKDTIIAQRSETVEEGTDDIETETTQLCVELAQEIHGWNFSNHSNNLSQGIERLVSTIVGKGGDSPEVVPILLHFGTTAAEVLWELTKEDGNVRNRSDQVRTIRAVDGTISRCIGIMVSASPLSRTPKWLGKMLADMNAIVHELEPMHWATQSGEGLFAGSIALMESVMQHVRGIDEQLTNKGLGVGDEG